MANIYGYCRCSTNETRQDITRQERELKALGVTNNKYIYKEYESGTKVNRVELQRLLDSVSEGDTIVATEVSRITRSTKQLCEIIEIAKNKHLKLILGSFVVDCTKELDPMTEGMLKMMGVFSELERNMISQRVKSGVANARSKGKIVGRPSLTINNVPQKVKDMYDLYKSGSISKTDYAKMCSVSRPTLDKYLKIILEG
ncbi:recombinase family protein [Clostridium beijerinckii]|uniref:DNA invertase Pin-like site-specific DNA recombinase n=1 Tax=Clostridium beijerinckii TaxID=1520 RepID=A0A7X9SRC8_CLOBE|nr:recombinase family protein [Clostridium beijerinckii]NMF06579.1 recombinase family protein [Clostridium beijerinckii]NRT92267.1 DNA invertase Pin-like site-specific DNA recombinase [Clostridium beijerinckii]NYC75590.1 DNA invertase Pin-like site-specific DNA recombinase [Clostridium beijerinckii]